MRTAAAHDRTHQAMGYQAEAARWHHDRAARGQADDPRVRMMRADALVRGNHAAAAAGEYLHVALGYVAQRRHQEALALAYQVLRLDAGQLACDEVIHALRRIGRPARDLCARAAAAHLQAGRTDDGLHMLHLGVELDPRDPDLHRRLAQVYAAHDMVAQAVAHLAEAAHMLLAAGNNAEYVVVAEQLLGLDAQDLQTLRELPRVYLRMGEPQRAVVKLADLMRVSPEDTVGREILAQAFAVLGRIPSAVSVLERLVQELASTGRVAESNAVLERARSWRLDDPELARAVLAVREPKPTTPRPALAQTTSGGTVVLHLADLAAAPTEVLDLSDDVELEVVELEVVELEAVELEEVEGTQRLRMKDLWHVSYGPRRPRRPPARRNAGHRGGGMVIDVTEVDAEDVTLVRRPLA
jgi:tetratricopeptide (TPR) repeat protein